MPVEHPQSADRSRPGLLDLVPRRLLVAVAWVIALAVLGWGCWLLLWLLDRLAVVVVPCAVALLFVALLMPLNSALNRARLPGGVAAFCSVLALLVALGGVGFLAETSIAAHADELVSQFSRTLSDLRTKIVNGPLPISDRRLDSLDHRIADLLQSAGQGTRTALNVTRTTTEIIAGILLGLFVLIFLLYDGQRVWQWFTGLFAPAAADRLRAAGAAAWAALSGFIQGTFVIACIHSIVIGSALWLLDVPIVLPLAVLVFVGSFIPVVGAFIAGGFAVLITLGTQGLGAAVTLLVVLVVENEIEAHLLQPFVIGRYVRLHPLAILTVLALGSVVAGVAGAVFSVPLTGVLRAVWGPLNGRESAVPVDRTSRIRRLWQWLSRRRAGKRS